MGMNIPTWLTSSANPENISLLVKGLATLLILIGADAAVVSQLQSDLLSLIVKAVEVAALVASVWGGMRKVQLGRWSAPKYSHEG